MPDYHPKKCPRCTAGGLCHDSRQMDTYVRRNYHCDACGCRWTTGEFMVDPGPVLKQGSRSVEDVADRISGKYQRDRVERAIEQLRELL